MINAIKTALLPITAFGAALALIAAPAAAQTRSVEVSYSGLDLTAPAGVAELDRRIAGAVRSICGRAAADLTSRQQVKDCRAEAFGSVGRQKTAAIAAAQTQRQMQELASR